jgi:nicotinamidase/pyrazinamidase
MRGLVLVDLQNDFFPGGAVPVLGADEVLPAVNDLQAYFDLVVATQDWHPSDHGSFAANHPGKRSGDTIELAGLEQRLWPVHCVENTLGADFVPGLQTDRISRVFRKGNDPAVDSYSGFFDNGRRHDTGLAAYLRDRDISDLYVCGLATDFCVRATALDAQRLGFHTCVVSDACRGIGDLASVMAELKRAGVEIVQSSQLLRTLKPVASHIPDPRASSHTGDDPRDPAESARPRKPR